MTSWMSFERFRFVQFMWHFLFGKTDSTTFFDIFRRVIMWTICEHLRLYNKQFFPSLTCFCYTSDNPWLFLKMNIFLKWRQKLGMLLDFVVLSTQRDMSRTPVKVLRWGDLQHKIIIVAKLFVGVLAMPLEQTA